MTQLRPPRVSVVMWGRDFGENLGFLGDVLAPGADDWEFLIAHHDLTGPAITDLLGSHPGMRIAAVRAAADRRASALNVAIGRSAGDYVCPLGPCDVLTRQFLSEGTSALDRSGALGLVTSRTRVFTSDGSSSVIAPSCELPQLLAGRPLLPTALLRRSAFFEAGGFDEGLPASGCEDWALWIGLLAHGYQGAVLDDVLLSRRCPSKGGVQESIPGDVPVELMQYLMRKHESIFRKYLFDLLAFKEAVSCQLQKRNYELEYEIDGRLVPEVDRLRRILTERS